MPDLWDRILRLFGRTPVRLIQQAPPPAKGYPNTLTNFGEDDHVKRPQIFEPSLRHFPRAFRQGDPRFDDSVTALRWHTARRTVMDSLLKRIAESSIRENCVLRGSRLMAAWFPSEAREPGDLDWVIVPRSIQFNDRSAYQIMAEIPQMIEQDPVLNTIPCVIEEAPMIGEIQILTSEIRSDEIWSYERTPGVRIVVPWRAAGIPPGSIQMDFAFGERLLQPPVNESISLFDGATASLNVVTPEQSLLWKAQWLLTDMSPQGKDLYDAILLAEHVTMPLELLKVAVGHADPWWTEKIPTLKEFQELSVEWEDFVNEYSWIEGTEADWIARLVRALRPTFEAGN